MPERRSLVLLVPPPNHPSREAELVFPRTPVQESGQGSGSTVTSIRAHLELDNPTRFHRDLLRGLRIPSGTNLLQISRQLAARVQRGAGDHPLLPRIYGRSGPHGQKRSCRVTRTTHLSRAWTRALLKNKAALGQLDKWDGYYSYGSCKPSAGLENPDGQGSSTYLLDLWHGKEGEYYSNLLEPLFFDALATGSRGDDPTFGFVPYLNGGLFRRNALEDAINDGGPVSLPDEIFDPEDHGSLLGTTLSVPLHNPGVHS